MDSERDKFDTNKSKDEEKEGDKPEVKEEHDNGLYMKLKEPIMFNSSQITTLKSDASNEEIFHASQGIGKGGGTIEVGGCKVVIPLNAVEKDIQEATVEKENVDNKIIAKDWLKPTTEQFVFSILEFSGYNAVLTGVFGKSSKFMEKNQDVQKLDDLFKFHQDVSSEVSQGIVAFEQLTGKLASINTETSPPLTYNRNNLQPVMKIQSNQMSQHDKGELDTETEDLDIEKINTEEMGNEDHKLEDDVPEITEEELKQEFQLFWSTRKTIGKDGGTIQVASCEVEIPPDALENNVEIEIAAFDCRKNKKLHLTPLLQCKPHGLKFNKVVKITLPTGRSAERKYSFIVRKLKTWNKYVIIGSGTTTSDKSFRFTVDRFSIYDVVPLGVQEYIGWRKEIMLVLAVTPDANEEPQQIDAHVLLSNNTEVALDGLKQVIKTTFPVLYSDQNLSLQVTGEDININPNDANKVERVWERSRVEKTFLLTRQNQQSMINKRIKVTVKSDHKTLHDDYHTITAYHLAPPPPLVHNINVQRIDHMRVGDADNNGP